VSALGISIIGWALLAAVYLPATAGFLWLTRFPLREKPRAVRLVVGVLLFAPLMAAVAEAAYVQWRWNHLCANAGLEVKKTVVVDGFYDDGFGSDGWDILAGGNSGFRFVEWKDKAGRYWRDEGFNEPKLRRAQIERPTARYHWKNPEFASPIGHLIKRRESTVVDTQTGEVIARGVMGYRYPATIDWLWARFMGGGPSICGGGDTMRALVGIDERR
jgi:hypothetical protein